MFQQYRFIKRILFVIAFFAALAAQNISAQTTVFTYQGKLTDAGGAANGNYQMEFRLFGSSAGADQIGETVTNTSVAVAQGIFTVNLDFGEPAFPGADRFLEIALRRTASDAYTTLNPRQQITSSPYSIRTLSAARADLALDSNKLGGIDASEYLTTTGADTSFIKNATDPQTANFNVTGNGVVGGNLGIGTSSPTSKLQVASGGYGITQTDGVVTVGSFITGAGGGGGWFGTRSNHPLNFFTNDNLAQMTLLQNGNFGVGITNPTARLQVLSSVAGTTGIFSESPSGRAIWGKSTTSRGVYGESDSLEGVYGISVSGAGVAGRSTSNIGVYGESSGSSGAGIYARNLFGGRAVYAEGNVAQNPSSNGLVKAMLYVQQDGAILRCYNGVANTSTGNCGFSVTRTSNGSYTINFNFQVSDRFVSVIARDPIDVQTHVGASLDSFTDVGPNSLAINTFITNVTTFGDDANFMIVVY